MRTLQFTAKCEHNDNKDDCNVAQKRIVDLLVNKLGQYGFQVLPQSGNQVAVSVDDHSLPLSIACQGQDPEGHFMCEITSYPVEDQDWLERITGQSLLNQLAQTVENILKEDITFSKFRWRN